jgi:deazaflavin-dependent oxidoreductase (nitroreductase family)
MLRLRTTGRRSGRRHDVIVAYIADGPDLLLVAMNGWAEPMPAWWLNLKAQPDTVVELPGGAVREVTAREAADAERERLWSLWQPVWKDLDAWATRRTTTPLIVLEPRRGSPA